MKSQIILVVFIIFHNFQENNSSRVSPNAIYEIVAKVDSKRCYTCEEDCSFPTLTNCDGVNKCFSKTIKNSDNRMIETKGCTEINLGTLCDDSNGEITSCYTCDSDFCNTDVKDNTDDKGVSKCYVCIDECAKPAAQHDCEEVLTAIEGKPVKAACLTYQIKNGDEVIISKGCIPDETVIKNTCNLANLVYPEVTCSTCDTDLCNGDKEDEENFVDECYYCEGICDSLEVHNCKELLGEEAQSKCIAVEYLDDNGQLTTLRTCAEINSSVQAGCDMINQQGGNCTICDTNLCNGIHKEEEDNYVDECYLCVGSCDTLEVEDCKENLGENAQSKCIAIEHTRDDGEIYIARGCVEVTPEVENTCVMINQQGGNCTICDTNLCNGVHKEDEDEKFVDECYYCDLVCEAPLEIHQCKEMLGENAKSKCFVKEYIEEGKTIGSRGCTEVNDEVSNECNRINQTGGNCTICDTNLCNGLSSAEILYSSISIFISAIFLLQILN